MPLHTKRSHVLQTWKGLLRLCGPLLFPPFFSVLQYERVPLPGQSEHLCLSMPISFFSASCLSSPHFLNLLSNSRAYLLWPIKCCPQKNSNNNNNNYYYKKTKTKPPKHPPLSLDFSSSNLLTSPPLLSQTPSKEAHVSHLLSQPLLTPWSIMIWPLHNPCSSPSPPSTETVVNMTTG